MHFLHTLFSLFINTGEFILFTVVAKMIIGKWLAERMLHWLQTKNGRNAAIWEHYHQDHAGEVEDCNVGLCANLQEMVTAIPQAV